MKKTMKSKFNNASGFTLIELLIAAMIITGGMVTMASFLGNLVSKNASNERKTMATVIAHEQIEILRLTSLQTTLTAAMGAPTVASRAHDADGQDIGATGTAGEFYTSTNTIDDSANPKQLTVVVSWVGRGNSQVTMTTLINN